MRKGKLLPLSMMVLGVLTLAYFVLAEEILVSRTDITIIAHDGPEGMSYEMIPDNQGPGKYNVTFQNEGTMIHDLTAEGIDNYEINVGEEVQFELDVPDEGLVYWCTLFGHRDMGMIDRFLSKEEVENMPQK